MGREPIDFEKARTLVNQTHLWHGPMAAGKTHLLGDALIEEEKKGPVSLINIKGEDGYLSIANTPVKNWAVCETIDTYDDLVAALADGKKKGQVAVGIEGLQRLYPLVYRKAFGSDRLPKITKEGSDWQDSHKLAMDLVDSLRYYAPIVVCTCATDKSVDQIRGETHITPDFPGRQAMGIGGHFDFVFFLESEVLGPANTRRRLLTQPVSKMVVRSRLPKPLPAEILIPANGGGWKLLQDAIQAALKKS